MLVGDGTKVDRQGVGCGGFVWICISAGYVQEANYWKDHGPP